MGQGDFYLRLGPEKLAEVRKAAEGEGLTVSGFIREAIELRLTQGGFPRSASRADVLAEIAEVTAKLGKGFILVPGAEARASGTADPWAAMMDQEGP